VGTEPIHLEHEANAGARKQPGAGICLVFTLTGVLLGLLSLLPQTPALVWNHTASLPIGLYSIERAPPAEGDIVVIAPRGELRATLQDYGVLPANHLLLKQLAAARGETVCRSHDVITIDGAPVAVARTATAGGRRLPAWSGCQRLAADQAMVLAHHTGSFDSRYIGPVSVDQIIGVAHPLITFPPAEAP
jgi:conjugative transfer signal peptidase TraF